MLRRLEGLPADVEVLHPAGLAIMAVMLSIAAVAAVYDRIRDLPWPLLEELVLFVAHVSLRCYEGLARLAFWEEVPKICELSIIVHSLNLVVQNNAVVFSFADAYRARVDKHSMVQRQPFVDVLNARLSGGLLQDRVASKVVNDCSIARSPACVLRKPMPRAFLREKPRDRPFEYGLPSLEVRIRRSSLNMQSPPPSRYC